MKFPLTTILLLLIFHFAWTVWLTLAPNHAFPANYYYNLISITIFIVPLIHSLKIRNIPWSLSFITAIIGQLIWSYYNFTSHVNAPFPGVGDIFWLLYYPFQFLVIRQLSQANKFTWNLQHVTLFLLLATIFTFFTSSFIFTNIDLGQPILTLILSFAYAFLDAILAALAVTLLNYQPSTTTKYHHYLVAAYIFIMFGDTILSYTASAGTYWNGNFVDFIYFFAHSLMALAVYNLSSNHVKLKSEESAHTLGTASRV